MFQPPQVNTRLVEQISAGIIPNSQRLNLVVLTILIYNYVMYWWYSTLFSVFLLYCCDDILVRTHFAACSTNNSRVYYLYCAE